MTARWSGNGSKGTATAVSRNSMHLTLAEWAQATGGEILAGDPAMSVGGECPGGLSIDSRTISPGQWFIALKGKAGRDGHEFLPSAINNGAAGVIVSSRDVYEPKVALSYPDLAALLVSDTTQALADAARALLDKFHPFVIAITGSVGKTGVKENIAHIASSRWPVLKNPHNWNTEIGLPLTIFEIAPIHRVAVLECASRGVGQIRHLSLIARPDIAVVTSIGPGHLSEFGTIDNVAAAKWEILDGLKLDGMVVASGESPYSKEYAGGYDMTTFGTAATNSVHPRQISVGEVSTRCVMATPVGEFKTEIPGVSRADLLNALCATACAINVRIKGDGDESLTLDEIADALRTLPSTPGRMEIIMRPSGIEVIFDAYNSNPVSLANALEALAARETRSDGGGISRRVAILGDMLELGEYEEDYHREAGRHVADLPIDCLITVGKLAAVLRESADECRGQTIEGAAYEATEQCVQELARWLRPGDLVLIKASRALALERLLDEDW